MSDGVRDECGDCGNKEFTVYNADKGILACAECGQFNEIAKVVMDTPSWGPPKGPPLRTIRYSLFGGYETKESIKAREDYQIYIKAFGEGLAAGRRGNDT